MANIINHKEGTPTVFADTTDFVATNSGFTRTDQLDLTGVIATEGRESAKADLGALRARLYAVRVGIEFDVAPGIGETVEFYWSASFSTTAGVGNDGGVSGTDVDYTDSEDEFKKQLIFLGVLIATADADTVLQYQTIGYFTPPHRFGSVVVINETAQAFEGDAVEMFVALVPILDEVQ